MADGDSVDPAVFTVRRSLDGEVAITKSHVYNDCTFNWYKFQRQKGSERHQRWRFSDFDEKCLDWMADWLGREHRRYPGLRNEIENEVAQFMPRRWPRGVFKRLVGLANSSVMGDADDIRIQLVAEGNRKGKVEEWRQRHGEHCTLYDIMSAGNYRGLLSNDMQIS
ncbi:hypothetical protein K432DRAFT_7693 [Lepidopterella palustris CBS 459.81]|uniref:Uncharacterized protein n=1 Tax=Lepidopterella palustris CBS 459.81 TaxID=1314670 RepID=A0A8E2DX00_9PEZI|nr:hypothetical protein K432DRAFT_7693 [Lepidopterella palustris CBS 459.81]